MIQEFHEFFESLFGFFNLAQFCSRARPALSFFLCERPLLVSVQQPNNLSQEAPLPFWLSFSFSLSPPPSLPLFLLLSCPRGYLLGLSEDLSFPMREGRRRCAIVGRWVGGHGLGLEHVHFSTHTHTYSSFSFSYAENRIVEALKGQKHVAVSKTFTEN